MNEAIESVAERIAEALMAAGFDCTDAIENALDSRQWFFDIEIDGIEATVVVSPYSGGTNWNTP